MCGADFLKQYEGPSACSDPRFPGYPLSRDVTVAQSAVEDDSIVNHAQDLSEQNSRDSDLRELECDGAAMSHDLCADLDQLLA